MSEIISYSKAAEKKWFLSVKPASPKQTLSIKFEDDKSYKYLGIGRVEKGDPVVIDYGGATSYMMGVVDGTENGVTIKRTHALNPLFAFTTEPSKAEIKKNVEAGKKFEDLKELDHYFGYMEQENKLHIIDHLVLGVLNAISALAFPSLTTAANITKIKLYLKEKQTVPSIYFSEKMSDRFFCDDIMSGFNIDHSEIIFSGFYPEWSDELLKCKFWEAEELKGVFKREDSELNQKTVKFNYAYGSAELEAFFDKNEEFNGFMNELILRSALSVIIKGGMVNLLEAALSTEMPIKSFYSKLKAYAAEIGSAACLNVLQSVDYENKTFDEIAVPKKSTEFDENLYNVENGILIKYLGDEENVVIPMGIKAISKEAFAYNKTIKSVVIPEGCKKIGDFSFAGCSNLEKAILPESLESIGKRSFAGVGIKEITTGKKVKSIGKEAFIGCTAIEKAVFKGEKTKFSEESIPSSIKELYIYSMEATFFVRKSYKIIEYYRKTDFYIRKGSAIEPDVIRLCEPEKVHYLDD